jgi:hypothetical protein
MAEDLNGLGRRVARRFVFRGAHPKPSDLAQQMGVKVVRPEAPPPAQPRLRAEYRPQPPTIVVYTDPLRELGTAVHVNQRFDMMRSDLTEVHIAHELFHHLESGGRFGPLSPAEVEEAAHEFAQELCELDFQPTEFEELLG